jgi:hypothetical protein
MSLSALGRRLDRAGAVASLACAVHCAAMPLVLVPLAGFGGAGSALETLFAMVSVLTGAASAGIGLRLHASLKPLLLVLGGGLLIVGRSAPWVAPSWETVVVVAGAGLVAGAHALNVHLCRCRECA